MSFKIYISSAGSGKTHSLAKEYINLCFKNPSYFKHILAVTFTNKATEEMKQRIIDYLDKIANSNYKSDNKIFSIVEDLKRKGLEESRIQNLSKEILNNILHEYTSFSVSTIDSFFSRILRSFSKELGLGGGYEIEMDEAKVISDLLKILWKKNSGDDKLLEYLKKFIFYNLEEGRSWKIDKSLEKIGREIFKDRYWERKFQSLYCYDDSREGINSFIEELNKRKSDFENILKRKGAEAEELINKFALQPAEFSRKERSVVSKLVKMKNNISFDDFKFSDTDREALTNDEKWYAKDSPKKKEIINCINSGLKDILNDAITYYDNNFESYKSAKIILNNIYVFGIFTDLINIMKEYETQENIIISSNISRKIKSVISENNSPFIFEKIGAKYKHFLIDEFQDTSTFQWQIFKQLILESISNNNLSLVVGDPKQGIYRWREGNIKLILENIYDDLSSFKNRMQTTLLEINYRSCENIIKFNNDFFANLIDNENHVFKTDKGKELYNEAYKNVHQTVDKEGGYINISIIEKRQKDNNKDNSSQHDEEESNSLDSIIKGKIIKIINEVLSKNYKQSDITILIRYSKEGTEIARAIIETGKDVISPDSLNILDSHKVNLIISILRFIVNQKDNLAITEFLNNLKYISNSKLDNYKVLSAFSELSTKEIFNKNITETVLWSVLPESLRNKEEKYYLSSFVYNYNVYELVENIIRIFNLDKEADLYILKFLDVVKEYCRNNSSDLRSFLNWLDTVKNYTNNTLFTISSPENTDAIKISTIHKIKGLKNKIIIIPYANWDIVLKGSRDIIWVSSDKEPFNKFPAFPVYAVKDLEYSAFSEDYNHENDLTLIDNINLLYVAFTRAEDALYIISSDKKSKDNIYKLIKTKIEELEKTKNYFKKPLFEEDDNFLTKTYSIGKLSEKKLYERDENIITTDLKFISSQWYKNIVIKTSDAENKPWEDNYSKIQQGVKIHKILSQLKSSDDIEKIINVEVVRENINMDEAKHIKERIVKLFSHKEFKLLFNKDWEVRTEAEIITPDEKVYRLDRVLIKNKEVKIIDFKIGKESKEHILQIKNYAKVLSEAGYIVVEKFLIYIADEIKIINV